MEWIIPAIAALVVGAGAGVGVSYASNKRKENGGKNEAVIQQHGVGRHSVLPHQPK